MMYWALFFFVTVGAKLVMAVVMIYFLLPTDRRCSECDEETILLGAGRTGRLLTRVSLGRVQTRWCPRCGWHGLSRRVPDPEPVRPTTGALR